ncbi:MAG: hypothetical protein LBB55_00295 [Zoogloeaceae bacterium]|nr:hypothetical protein [Zoogloeaceae bacterium]
MMGLMAMFMVIPVAIWMLFQLVRAIRRMDSWKNFALRVGVWFIAFALVYGIHANRDHSMRQQADAIVAKIGTFQEKHGTCPPTLEAINESQKSLNDKLGALSFYRCEQNKPYLHYLVPYIPFAGYLYDFERKTWIVSD